MDIHGLPVTGICNKSWRTSRSMHSAITLPESPLSHMQYGGQFSPNMNCKQDNYTMCIVVCRWAFVRESLLPSVGCIDDPVHVFSHNQIGYPWHLPRALLSKEHLLWDLNARFAPLWASREGELRLCPNHSAAHQ